DWTENALGRFDRTYDGVTPRLTQTVAQTTGHTTNYSYFGNDHDRRLQTLQNLAPGGANLSRFDYTYDVEGQIMSWNRQLGTTTSGRWFDYDDARQLLSARNALFPSAATEVNGFVYDNAGNRTSDSHFNSQGLGGNGTFHTYTPNEVNQIDSFETQQGSGRPSSADLTYDFAGNLTDDGQGKTFEWDGAGRLIAINYGGTGDRSEFLYDGLGRRVQILEKTGATVTSTKQFVWVGNRIAQERDERNAITRQNFAEGEFRERSYYYARDHLGSIRELTSSGGGLAVRYDYDPYGQRTKVSGSDDVDFGYTGHYFHQPSGLNLTLYRVYSPAMGRWISKDPIGENGGVNLYAYVGNAAIGRTDPLGLCQAPVYNPSVWNDPAYVGINNCYSYACDVRHATPSPGTITPQPGGESGAPVSTNDCAILRAAAKRDGLQDANAAGNCPKCYHKVRLYAGDHVHQPGSPDDLGRDYHWYRQDSNGRWSSKHGLDPVGPQVPDPDTDANSWGYDVECGTMCARD
ncbi:MAG: RHS repeat-associated core domain-containing protein, partial [Chthoniobacterales bacterium]